GCLAWSSASPCPTATPYCGNGTCAAQCVDECTTGETMCDSTFTERTCGPSTTDSCLHWSLPTACASNQTCTGTSCGATHTCAQDGDHCDDGDPCTQPDTCSGGVCQGSPKCTTAPAHGSPTCASDGTCGFTCQTGYMVSGSSCVAFTPAPMPTAR